MTPPAQALPVDIPSVVVLLTRDRGLVEALAHGLVERNSSLEIHVVRTVPHLAEHLQVINADAVIIDRPPDGLSGVSRLLEGTAVGDALVIVLDAEPTDVDLLSDSTVDRIEWLRRSPELLIKLNELLAIMHRAPILERRLQETIRHYRDILDASGDGIFVLTGSRLTYVNESLAATLGRTSSELLEQADLIELVAETDRVMLREELARISSAAGRRELFELSLKCADQSFRRFEVSCRSSVVTARRTIVGVARDVTALRQLQEEIERARERTRQTDRLRALGELAAGVAHDFNNVLETLLGRVALARDKLGRSISPLDDLNVIAEAAKNAATTVKRIQDFARPTSGSSWHDVDLQHVVRDAAEFIRTRVPGNVKFDLQIHPTPTIRGNGAELREVLLNLLFNSLDALNGSGRISLRCATQIDHAVVEVEDTGVGMTPEVQQRIFEPFFSTKGQRGTGLGLSVSHGILRRHDAKIELRSAPGQGTRFTLAFSPLTLTTAKGHAPSKDSLLVAVVDDDHSIGELLKDLLEELGHRVFLIDGAQQTLAFIAENPIDLLITDLDLPEVSGWQLARNVRQIRPEILVGLITGWPLSATEEELKSRGVDFVLAKPFSMDALAHALANKP